MSIINKRRKEILIFFIFIAAFSTRIIYARQVLEFPLTEYLIKSNTFDQHGFDRQAIAIASVNWAGGGDVFGKEPLYSYFLALIYRIFGYNHFASYMVQAFLTSIGVVLLYKISRRIFNSAAGYIAAFILAFYAISIYYDVLLLRESFITFVNILLFYLLIESRRHNKGFFWFVSGIVLGFSVLLRHNMLLPFIVCFILFSVKDIGNAVRNILIFIAGVFIVFLPIVVRNYIVSDHKMIGISTEVNAFWVGNTYNASGVDVVWSPEYHAMNNKSEGDIKKIACLFFSEIKKRPKEYLKLYLRKIWMFFNAYEAPSNTNYYLYKEEFPTILRWPLFNFRVICAFGITGFLLSLFMAEKPYLAYIFIIVLSGSVILFHIQSRFRLPAVPFFIIFSSYSSYYLFDKIKKKDILKSLAITGLVICLYIVLKPDLTYAGFRKEGEKIRAIDRTNLAMAYIDDYERNGRNESLRLALNQCDLAIKEERRSYIPYSIEGYIYMLENRFDSSIDEYKKALIYESKNPFLYNEFAGVYYVQKSYKKSFVYIKRALKLFPENKIFKKNLDILPVEGCVYEDK